jgi:hypothetical protein
VKTKTKRESRPIIVYGSHLGGTLATSLALTECKDTRNMPFNITGLIAKNAILDFASLASTPSDASSQHPSSPTPTPPPEANSNPSTLETDPPLTLELSTLFVTPAQTHDTFASPLLFFRTPGLAIPQTPYFPGHEPPSPSTSSLSTPDLAGLSLSEEEYAALSSTEFDILPPSAAKVQELDEPIPKSAHLKFPPREAGLRIPRSLFLSSRGSRHPSSRQANQENMRESENEKQAQMEAMVRLMRRSVVVHEFRERVLWDEGVDPHGAAEGRVGFVALGGESEGEVEEERVVGEWLENGGF